MTLARHQYNTKPTHTKETELSYHHGSVLVHRLRQWISAKPARKKHETPAIFCPAVELSTKYVKHQVSSRRLSIFFNHLFVDKLLCKNLYCNCNNIVSFVHPLLNYSHCLKFLPIYQMFLYAY